MYLILTDKITKEQQQEKKKKKQQLEPNLGGKNTVAALSDYLDVPSVSGISLQRWKE